MSWRAVVAPLGFYQSLSLLQLILLGFLLIALPLAAVLGTALVSIDRLSSLGQHAALEAFHRIQAARTLVEEVTAMERSARQYQILADSTLFDAYATRRQRFLGAVENLWQSGGVPREQIHSLTELDRVIFEGVRDEPVGSRAMSAALEEFSKMGLLARGILEDSVHIVAQEIQIVQTEAAADRERLLWQASALPPVIVGLAILFAVLIARPLRQLNTAIRGLGTGEFDKAVVVNGPHDLADLGRHLDWLRERLMELEGQKITFLRDISHELKTPLANIREGTGLLSDQVMGPLNPQQQEIAHIVQTNCVQLQKLIEDLTHFSIARTAMPVIEAAPIKLDELIQGLAERHKPSAQAHGVRLELRLSDENVISDADKIRVIGENLLSNAIKFSPVDSCVTIATGRQDGKVFVEVQDEGPGIPVGERERVFELFYQGHLPAHGQERGSGLGLAIAREYARALGGRLQVADSHGVGARLRLEFPASGGPPLTDPEQHRLGAPA